MSLNMHDVRITMDGPGRGKVFLDGTEVKAVRDLTFRACAGEFNTCTMTLAVGKADIDASGAYMLDITDMTSTSRVYSLGERETT
jgi:hypothetical protein